MEHSIDLQSYRNLTFPRSIEFSFYSQDWFGTGSDRSSTIVIGRCDLTSLINSSLVWRFWSIHQLFLTEIGSKRIKSSVVRLALNRLQHEMERQDLERSADLYAEVDGEDGELEADVLGEIDRALKVVFGLADRNHA